MSSGASMPTIMPPSVSISTGSSKRSRSNNSPEEIEMTVSPVAPFASPALHEQQPQQPQQQPQKQQQHQQQQQPGSSGQIELAPPVAQQLSVTTPALEYWDEKICLEAEYSPEHSLPQMVTNQDSDSRTPISPNSATTSAAPLFPQGSGMDKGDLRRSASNASSVGPEPAPAYKTYSEAEISNMSAGYRGEAGLAPGSVPRPSSAYGFLFGYPRKTVLYAAVALAAVVLIIIFVAVGVTVGKSGSGAGGAAGLMANSRVAAMNWTELTGVTHSSVVYQHSDRSIMMATRDSLSNVWRTVNVTDQVIQKSKVTALDVLPGSSFSTTSNNAQHNIYYQNSFRQVQELWSTDGNGNLWNAGVLGGTIQGIAAQGSRISSAYQMCTNCSKSLLVVWQEDGTNAVRMANFTNSQWRDGGVVTQNATPGTALTMSTFNDFRGASGTDPTALRIYMSAGANLVEWLNGPLNRFQWAQGNFGKPLTSGLSVNPSPEIASITYGPNGWFNNLLSYLDPNGLLQSAIWRGDTWSVQPATIANFDAGQSDGKTAKFTAISASQDMRLFGVVDGRIHVMKSLASNPFQWTWESVIST